MGKGADRNKKCPCGSGKKIKKCNCKYSTLEKMFPNSVIPIAENVYFHPLGFFDSAEYEEIQNTDEMKYTPFYSMEEIRKIQAPSTASDVLLKKQADSVADQMRVRRCIYKKYNLSKEWTSEELFDDSLFVLFELLLQDTGIWEQIKDIPCGMTYDRDPNGHCIKTQFGDIITISAMLEQFLFFMNLFYMGVCENIVPDSVMQAAVTIAIRIMLQNESLDFEIDPRGDIPEEIEEQLILYTKQQMFFVLAHEYSHSILKHLQSNNVIFSDDGYVYYNKSQLQEFEADQHAIEIISNFTNKEDAVAWAISFFLAIDIYEQAKEQISPSFGYIQTHPDPLDRAKKLLEKYPCKEIDIDKLINRNEKIKTALMELIATNFEQFEFYGSIYLGEWYKNPKRDRIDY